eukprot:1403861-Amphidinium_carterae.3
MHPVLQAIWDVDTAVGTRLEIHMESFGVNCVHPAKHVKYPASYPICHDCSLSVQFFGQYVKMGKKENYGQQAFVGL